MGFKEIADISSPFIAVGSLAVAAWTLYHTKKVEQRLTQDERLVFGPLRFAALTNAFHRKSVLVVRVVNVGRRRATIDKILAVNRLGEPLDVSWSNEIDAFGNPIDPLELVAVESSLNIYILLTSRPIHTQHSRFTIHHSQSKEPAVLIFNDET